MQIKIIISFLVLILSFSCNSLPESIGQPNTITLVVSDEDRDLVLLSLEPILNNYIYTPILENLYDINIITGREFKNNMFNKNIIVASLDYPIDNDVDLLSNKLNSKYNNQGLISLYELYSKDQILISLSSHDAVKFDVDINNNKKWILNEINNNIDKNMLNRVMQSPQEKTIVNKIENKFNLNMFIDENYKMINEDDNFIWIGRGMPYRWIVINQINQNENSQIDYMNYIKTEMTKKLGNVNIIDYNLNLTNTGDNLIARGIYEHLDSDTGGPFFTYIFENIVNNKVIFVSGFVNNPGKSKGYLLLQLETIIKNIKEIHEE